MVNITRQESELIEAIAFFSNELSSTEKSEMKLPRVFYDNGLYLDSCKPGAIQNEAKAMIQSLSLSQMCGVSLSVEAQNGGSATTILDTAYSLWHKVQ